MFTKVLVPLDGSEHAEAVLPFVEDLGQRCAAEIILLQVVPMPRDTATAPIFQAPMSLPGSTEDEVIARHPILRAQEIESRRVETERSLGSVKERLSNVGLSVRVEVLFGRPANRIVEYALKEEVDLIIMSTIGRSGFSRWMFGSVADKVLRAVAIPILLIRPPGAQRHGQLAAAEDEG
jgi:nucleotide-binding universal stress UspA family protein